MDSDKADMVAQFSAITGANPSMAENALGATNWNLEQSVALFYDEQAEAPDGDADEALAAAASSSQPTPAASAQASASSAAASGQSGRGKTSGRPQQMSFRDLQRGEQEDDDDEEDGKRQDMFAGGEKSGLAVQNPDRPVNHFNNIMNQARQNRERPPVAGEDDDEEEEAPARPSNFGGRAQTLGGDDVPSRVVADPLQASQGSRRNLERVTRTLHLWQDGVSVDDGPLFAFEDPANANIMAQIQQGRAPNALLNVQPNQEVDLNLEPHQGQNYVQPKKQYKPFGGSGQRLGSPTPGPAPSSTIATTSSASSSALQTSASAAPAEVTVDAAQPTVQMQIRLGDGTRLASRFNTSHTLGDIYDFVDRASTASQQRAYVLQTTFPPTEFSDRTKVLGDISDFKRGGVLVQKWK